MKLNGNLALRAASIGSLAVLLTGCLSPVRKQSAALAGATTPVVEQASTAYHDANALYDTAVDYEAARDFDRKDPVYNPRRIGVLLPERDIAVRVKVLEAFQLYVENLVAITGGTESPALEAASRFAGNNLAGLGNDLSPMIAPATQTEATPASAAAITPIVRNGVSTAAYALGEFLIQRKIKHELPAIILRMDPQIKILCELLQSDLDVLQEKERRDYDTLIDLQTEFIRKSVTLNAEDRRNEIMKLPGIVRRQRRADAQLTALRASIGNLYLTHHALAVAAQSDNRASLKSKLGELEEAGSNLGTFYSSLPKN